MINLRSVTEGRAALTAVDRNALLVGPWHLSFQVVEGEVGHVMAEGVPDDDRSAARSVRFSETVYAGTRLARSRSPGATHGATLGVREQGFESRWGIWGVGAEPKWLET